MKSFLFITHLTPLRLRSSLRQELFDLHIKALHRQTYTNWKVLVFSEEEKTDGKFTYVKLLPSGWEEGFVQIRSVLARKDVKDLIDQSDYIVKLDDDDIISPFLLEDASEKDFDCYYDVFHTFYEISSGIISQQKRPWIASTCIQKTEHAFAPYSGPGSTSMRNLLYSDHSLSWSNYYKDKKIILAKRESPVYMRVVSPSSIAASASGGRVMKFSDVSVEKYMQYLSSFGNWESENVKGFEEYLPELKAIWMRFSGTGQEPLKIEKPGIIKKILKKLKRNSK